MTMLHASPSPFEKPARLPARLEASIEDFFRDYGAAFNRVLRGASSDADEVADALAPYFVAGPRGGSFLRWMIPRGLAHARRLGARALVLEGIQVEPIDDQVASARVRWHAHLIRSDGTHDHFTFDVAYLLHLERGRPRIFAYLSGDEGRALSAHALC